MAATATNREILEKLGKLDEKVDQSLAQGTALGQEVALLRKELGIDGAHGRIPSLESQITDHEIRIKALERVKFEGDGRVKFIHFLLVFLGGSLGSLLTFLAHILRYF